MILIQIAQILGTAILRDYLVKIKIKVKLKSFARCCYICPRDSCPRRPWSEGTYVQGTVVQGEFGPRRLLSKEAFTSDKLAQLIFLYSLLDITILIDIKMTKNNMNST